MLQQEDRDGGHSLPQTSKTISHPAVLWLVRLLCSLQGEGGACMQTHSPHSSLPTGRVSYVNLQEKWWDRWKPWSKCFFFFLFMGYIKCWQCNSLSERKVSAKYSVRTRPVKESSEERASIFLWTGASSISASSASRRAFASWSYTRDEWRMLQEIKSFKEKKSFLIFSVLPLLRPNDQLSRELQNYLGGVVDVMFP